MKQLYAVMYDDADHPYYIKEREEAVALARNLSKQGGRRVNIFKLVQTHTYKLRSAAGGSVND